ncbi:TPA: helix-turn-helix domain-containing protein [Stenotrophomonas maltophilia]
MKIDDTTRAMLSQLPPDFPMTASQAAALMRVSTKTLQRLRNQGLPPPILGERPKRADDGRWSTSPVRYAKADVDAWCKHPLMPSVHLHAYQMANGRITAEATDLDDNTIVGGLLALITELPWANTALMIEAEGLLRAEHTADLDAVQQAISYSERQALTEALEGIECAPNPEQRKPV